LRNITPQPASGNGKVTLRETLEKLWLRIYNWRRPSPINQRRMICLT
jgi:hypothetical protein